MDREVSRVQSCDGMNMNYPLQVPAFELLKSPGSAVSGEVVGLLGVEAFLEEETGLLT